MSATMDMLDVVEQAPAAHRDVAVRSNRSKQYSSTTRRRHVERWSTGLDPHALQCVLAMLEQQVIPHLIAGYAPATGSPLGPPES